MIYILYSFFILSCSPNKVHIIKFVDKYPLHRAIYELNIVEIEKYLETYSVSQPNKYGHTSIFITLDMHNPKESLKSDNSDKKKIYKYIQERSSHEDRVATFIYWYNKNIKHSKQDISYSVTLSMELLEKLWLHSNQDPSLYPDIYAKIDNRDIQSYILSKLSKQQIKEIELKVNLWNLSCTALRSFEIENKSKNINKSLPELFSLIDNNKNIPLEEYISLLEAKAKQLNLKLSHLNKMLDRNPDVAVKLLQYIEYVLDIYNSDADKSQIKYFQQESANFNPTKRLIAELIVIGKKLEEHDFRTVWEKISNIRELDSHYQLSKKNKTLN